MTKNNLKLTKTHLAIVIMIIIFAAILFFVFLNKPTIKQTQNLQESNNTVTQSQDNFNYRDQLVNQLIGEEKQSSENEISSEFVAVDSRFMVVDFFDKLIEEGYLENSDFDEQQGNMTLYLDSSILFDKRVETWITVFAMQVMGNIENQNDFVATVITTPDTGDVTEFAIAAKVVPSTERIANLPENTGKYNFIEIREAIETSVGDKGHARILDLVVGGEFFAHFETGEVFAELERLGLIGVLTKGGNMIREPSLKLSD